MLAILNAQNSSGNTALHWAALNGNLDAVKVLLEEGADPTITNERGHDAVFEAELNDKKDVVDWVLKEGGEGLEEGVVGVNEAGEEEDKGDEEEEEGLDAESGIDMKELNIKDTENGKPSD
jgi:ankyrin repeat protein